LAPLEYFARDDFELKRCGRGGSCRVAQRDNRDAYICIGGDLLHGVDAALEKMAISVHFKLAGWFQPVEVVLDCLELAYYG